MQKNITSFDGTRIMYHYYHHSPNHIIFLHGLAMNSAFWSKEAELFRKLGFSVIVPDFRGHGSSGKPLLKESYLPQHFAQDLHAIITAENLGKVNIVGHSFGGGIAIIYHHLYPSKVKSLTLVNTDYKVPLLIKLLVKARLFPNLLRFTSLKKFTISASHQVVSHCIINLEEYAHQQNISRLLSSIRIPTLIITSTKDELIPRKHVEEMHHLMGGEYVEIEGHHALFNENAKDAGIRIIDFLAEHHAIRNMGLTKMLVVMAAAVGAALLSTPGYLSDLSLSSSSPASITGAAIAPGFTAFGGGAFIFKAIVFAILLAGLYAFYKTG